ncbi:MAG: 3-hydroxyacyl-CoA dehydrogenase family protein [Thermodesulfobacteriota bacterium]
MTDIRNVTIVGAGTMGHCLAQVFAQGGHEVWLTDIRAEILERARALIAANLRTLAEMKRFRRSEIAPTLGRIRTTTVAREACANADMVIEAISEDRSAKKALFRRLDRIAPPDAILASNTSYLNIFTFVETRRPDKVLITHWFAPPHIVPLVEIVRGPETSQTTVDRVEALIAGLGKKPVVLSRFLPGFIANRLQSALTHEVLYLLDNGYATPQQIDEVTKSSFGLRMPILGLTKRMDYAGLDLTRKVLRNGVYQPPPRRTRSGTLDRLAAAGRLGVKTGGGYHDYGNRSAEEIMRERDVKLIKLKAFLEEMGEL